MWPLFLLWDMGLSSIVIQLTLGILGLHFFFGFWRKRVYYLQVHDATKGHNWCIVTNFENTTHCNVCEQLLISGGAMCDSCGICADNDCVKIGNRKLSCKAVSADEVSLKHHWVKGNLPLESQCHVCDNECGLGESLSDFRCSWCQWTVHEKCLPNLSELCNLGCFKNYIIPPNCVTLQRNQRMRLRSQCVISKIRTPLWGSQWKPLIVIGNVKSGSSEAHQVLSSARHYLNAIQVIDISVQDLHSALHLCNLLDGVHCRLLIAGGDGTIAWVLNTMQELKLKYLPESAILPLGTGNDLSRVLGWGPHLDGPIDFPVLMRKISNSSTVPLDRWLIELRPNRHLGFRFPIKRMKFNNYFSVGVDARVALNFHQTRQSPLYIFSHRLFNKLIYFSYGTRDVVEQSCEGLEQKVRLYINNKLVDLPAIQAIVFLNIQSWGAGVRPWHMGQGGSLANKSSFNDGLLEIIGITSSLHIAQMQIGLSEPIRFGQSNDIKLLLSSRLPLQIDGEPWEQSPCEIHVKFSEQVPMLQCTTSF